MLMLLMMCTYFLWVGVGTSEREWVWLQIAAEMKHAIADSEPEFVVACACPGQVDAQTRVVGQRPGRSLL